jgi:hypothetical protein
MPPNWITFTANVIPANKIGISQDFASRSLRLRQLPGTTVALTRKNQASLRGGWENWVGSPTLRSRRDVRYHCFSSAYFQGTFAAFDQLITFDQLI